MSERGRQRGPARPALGRVRGASGGGRVPARVLRAVRPAHGRRRVVRGAVEALPPHRAGVGGVGGECGAAGRADGGVSDVGGRRGGDGEAGFGGGGGVGWGGWVYGLWDAGGGEGEFGDGVLAGRGGWRCEVEEGGGEGRAVVLGGCRVGWGLARGEGQEGDGR